MFKADTILCSEQFSYDTGIRMGESLIQRLGSPPKACWLFCSPEAGLTELVQGIYDAVKTRNLVGCTTDGEISSIGFSTRSAVLGGIVSDRIDFEIACAQGISRGGDQAGRDLAASLSADVAHVQLFSDGITGNGCAILRGLTSILPSSIPVSGGAAGDRGRFVQTFQIFGNRLLSDAAVAIGFRGRFRLGTGCQSGWSPIGLPKKVTRASGNILYELNGEPALNVYERFLGKHSEKLPAVGVEYPLGFVDPASGQFLLRATMSVNCQNGSIAFGGEVPDGAMVYLTCGDRSAILDAAGKAARCAIEDLGDADPAMVFFYSCMARKSLLGLWAKEEYDGLRQVIHPRVPVIGFYTYGEYARIRPGMPAILHNETATVAVIGM